MMSISGEIIQELSRLLTPFMWDKQQRQAYLLMALGNNSHVFKRLVWDTSVQVFIPQMVNELVISGEIINGKPALCVVLEVIRDNVGVEVQIKLNDLLLKIQEVLTENHVSEVYRQDIDEYFTFTLNKFKEQGCSAIQKNIIHGNYKFNYIVRISDFELSFPLMNMRGEAFFMFSHLNSINMKILQQFSSQSIKYAKKQVNPSAVGQAWYNFRIPTHLCFAITIVENVDDKTAVLVKTTNPLDHKVDILWYEVPIIYELSQKRLLFYEQPSNILENFKGEIVWRKLRDVILDILSGKALNN